MSEHGGALPSVEVRSPAGERSSVPLRKDRVTVGRLAEFNDIPLEPDPERLVTRMTHCALVREGGAWWVVDNEGVNPTYLERGGTVDVVRGRAALADGDVIRVLGGQDDAGEALYWEIAFRDPLGTRPAADRPTRTVLEYDRVQAKLFRVRESAREEIDDLQRQEHLLIRFMDARNRANGNVPTLCEYDELIDAIWSPEDAPTKENLNHLLWGLRKKIEADSRNPEFLVTVRGLGYRLEVRPV